MKHIVITQPMGLSEDQLTELKSLGKVTYYDTISKDTHEWLERVKDADIIYSNNYGLDDGWKELKDVYITYPFVTTSFLDMELLKKNKVLISNSPGCNQIAVTEWIVGMLLNHFREFPKYIKTTKIDGPIPPKTKSIYGQSVCIIGKGTIGTRAGKALETLGMEVSYYTRNDDLEAKIKDVDVIIDCLSHNPSTTNFYNKKFFEQTKDGVVFLSISLNETKDIQAIIDGLAKGKIGHYISDNASALVFNAEDKNYKALLDNPKITITPHIAAYSDNTLQTASKMCIENIKAYLAGKPIRLVYNPTEK